MVKARHEFPRAQQQQAGLAQTHPQGDHEKAGAADYVPLECRANRAIGCPAERGGRFDLSTAPDSTNASGRAVDADVLTIQNVNLGNGLVDTFGQGFTVCIPSTTDDSIVNCRLAMQPFKITPVECQDDPAEGARRCQNMRVIAAGLIRFLNREYVMPQQAKELYDRVVKVLVSIETGHASHLDIADYGLVNLVAMLVVVSPCRLQVSGRQTLNTGQDSTIVQAVLASEYKSPYIDVGVAYARFGSIWMPTLLDPARCSRQLALPFVSNPIA